MKKRTFRTAGCLTRLKYEKLSKNLLVIYGDYYLISTLKIL